MTPAVCVGPSHASPLSLSLCRCGEFINGASLLRRSKPRKILSGFASDYCLGWPPSLCHQRSLQARAAVRNRLGIGGSGTIPQCRRSLGARGPSLSVGGYWGSGTIPQCRRALGAWGPSLSVGGYWGLGDHLCRNRRGIGGSGTVSQCLGAWGPSLSVGTDGVLGAQGPSLSVGT